MGGVLTDITFILDRSGSMAGLVDDTIGGFNTFLAEQKKVAGAANVTLVSFADHSATVYAGKPLADAPPLTRETYSPSGNTALYDAICETVDAAGARFATMSESERPGMVMVVIITDGEENRSRKFSREDVFQRITTQQDVYKWTFLFLGANQDAFKAAGAMGIPQNLAASYSASAAGVAASYGSVSEKAAGARHVYLVSGAVRANQNLRDIDLQKSVHEHEKR
jgi:uncharacterized protein YegL